MLRVVVVRKKEEKSAFVRLFLCQFVMKNLIISSSFTRKRERERERKK